VNWVKVIPNEHRGLI